jgi:hypothetical protein
VFGEQSPNQKNPLVYTSGFFLALSLAPAAALPHNPIRSAQFKGRNSRISHTTCKGSYYFHSTFIIICSNDP